MAKTLSGKGRRQKGAAGEREVLSIMRDQLGDETIQRNLSQTRDAGHDVQGVSIEGWAIEIKRHKTSSAIRQWWAQAYEQAAKAGKVPALLYRVDRGEWTAVVPVCAVIPDMTCDPQQLSGTASIHIDVFCDLIRESVEYKIATAYAEREVRSKIFGEVAH